MTVLALSWCPNWPVIWHDIIVATCVVGGLVAFLFILYEVDRLSSSSLKADMVISKVRYAFRVACGFLIAGSLGLLAIALIYDLIKRWFPC